jgi:selenophosphate synthase
LEKLLRFLGKIATPRKLRLMSLQKLCDRQTIVSLVVSVTAKQRLHIQNNQRATGVRYQIRPKKLPIIVKMRENHKIENLQAVAAWKYL